MTPPDTTKGKLCGVVLRSEEGFGKYKIPPQPDKIVTRCGNYAPCPIHQTPSVESWEEEFDRLFQLEVTPLDTANERYAEIMQKIAWEPIKSFISSLLSRERKATLEAVRGWAKQSRIPWPEPTPLSFCIADGYNQALTDLLSFIDKEQERREVSECICTGKHEGPCKSSRI